MRFPILVIGNFLSGAGRSRSVCEDLAERLAAAGWPVLTASGEPRRLRRLMEMVSTVWRRRREYLASQVDVYGGRAFIWADIVSGCLGIVGKPFILTLHGGGLPDFARRWPGRVRSVLRRASAVTVPSEYLRKEMKPYRGDLELVPNALDLSAYEFRPRTRPQPRLIWMRAFHDLYNPSMAAKVVALLARDVPGVHLIMIGADKGDRSLEVTRQEAARLRVTGRVEILDRVPKSQVGRFLGRGDIFLNTANVDNTPVSILEAMACGLCVVSTNVGGIPDLLSDGQDALLVPPRDPGTMTAAIRRVLFEPGLAERLSGNARRKVERFDWSVVLPQWESLLIAACGNSRGERQAQRMSGDGAA